MKGEIIRIIRDYSIGLEEIFYYRPYMENKDLRLSDLSEENQKYVVKFYEQITNLYRTQLLSELIEEVEKLPIYWERQVDGYKGTPLPDCPRNIQGYKHDIITLLKSKGGDDEKI